MVFVGLNGVPLAIHVPIGFYGGYGWGWNNWRYNWRGGGRVEFGRRPYISHSNVIVNRGGFGGGARNFNGGRNGSGGATSQGSRGAVCRRPQVEISARRPAFRIQTRTPLSMARLSWRPSVSYSKESLIPGSEPARVVRSIPFLLLGKCLDDSNQCISRIP